MGDYMMRHDTLDSALEDMLRVGGERNMVERDPDNPGGYVTSCDPEVGDMIWWGDDGLETGGCDDHTPVMGLDQAITTAEQIRHYLPQIADFERGEGGAMSLHFGLVGERPADESAWEDPDFDPTIGYVFELYVFE